VGLPTPATRRAEREAHSGGLQRGRDRRYPACHARAGDYIPPEDIRTEYLTPTARGSFCEYKGAASYYTITVNGAVAQNAAWFYPRPTPGFAVIRDYVAFYPGRMEACFVDGEQVVAQPGDFYGGWITKDIVGPFKGGAGTTGW
jgi:hypothetical protein